MSRLRPPSRACALSTVKSEEKSKRFCTFCGLHVETFNLFFVVVLIPFVFGQISVLLLRLTSCPAFNCEFICFVFILCQILS